MKEWGNLRIRTYEGVGRPVLMSAPDDECAKDKWVKDDTKQTCQACGTKFTFFRRQHHCRPCGKLFCSACAEKGGKECRVLQAAKQEKIRACGPCHERLERMHRDEYACPDLGDPNWFDRIAPSRDGVPLLKWENLTMLRAPSASEIPDHVLLLAPPAKSDTDQWAKDAECGACTGCAAKFGTVTRKHHCRACGHIFCSTCARKRDGIQFRDKTIPIRIVAEAAVDSVRACTVCSTRYDDLINDRPTRQTIR